MKSLDKSVRGGLAAQAWGAKTRGGVVQCTYPFSVGDGDGIESVILTLLPRVSGLLPPFAAGPKGPKSDLYADPGEYPKRA